MVEVELLGDELKLLSADVDPANIAVVEWSRLNENLDTLSRGALSGGRAAELSA